MIFLAAMAERKWHTTAMVVWLLLCLLVIGQLLPAVAAAFASPAALAGFATNKLHRPDLMAVISERITGSTLVFIRVALMVLLTGMAIVATMTLPTRNSWLQHLLQKLSERLKAEGHLLRSLPPKIQWLLFGVVVFYLVTRLYMIITVPLERDESMSYYYFIKPGPLVAMSYYPYPNNHPLYSLLAWPFGHLPLPMGWKIRLPALVVGLAGIWLGFRLYALLFRRRSIAVAAVAIMISLFPYGRFSVYGRGYLLQLCVALLIMLLYWRALGSQRPPPLRWLTFLYAMGFYTLPTFLYFATVVMPVMGLVFWQRGLVQPWPYARHVLVSAGFTALLFLPFVITNGSWEAFKAVVYSGYDATVQWSLAESWQQGKRGWNIFLLRPREEITCYIVLAMASAGLWLISRRRQQWGLVGMALLLLWLPMLAHLWQRLYIPERAFTPITMVLPAGLLAFAWLWRKSLGRGLWAAGLAVLFSINYLYYFFAPDYPGGQERTLDATAAIFAQKLLVQKADTLYLDDGWYRPVIEATYHEAGRPLVIFNSNPESPNYRPYQQASHYDAVIIRSHTPWQPAPTYTEKMVRPDAIMFAY